MKSVPAGGKGKKRSCFKGKSCGASCVSKTKVCRIELKTQFWKDLDKLIKEVQGYKPAPKKVKAPATKVAKSEPKVNVRFGEVDGERVNLNGKLSPLTDDHLTKLFKPTVTESDYKSGNILFRFAVFRSKFQYDNQDSLQKDVHSRAIEIFVNGSLRTKLLNELGWSLDRFNKVEDTIRDFTSTAYIGLRASQKSTPVNQEFESQKLRDLDAFLKAAPKEDVVKYRSHTSDNQRLKERIAAAKKKRAKFKERAVTSWSTDPVASAAFMRYTSEERPNRVMLRTVNKTGVSVRSVSSHEDEDEILTNRGNYRYVGYKEVKIGNDIVHVFDVEEDV